METKIGVNEFWSAISILLRNYNAVNKKIFDCIIEKIYRVTQEIDKSYDFTRENTTNRSIEELAENEIEKCFQETPAPSGFLIDLKFLTKRFGEDIFGTGIIDICRHTFICKMDSNIFDDFAIHLQNGKLSVNILTQRSDAKFSTRWAETVLLPKLVKWTESVAKDGLTNKKQKQSIQLVNPEAYNNLYKHLKKKYAEKTLKFWSDAEESTDPLKFIYEDLAIASYLICLWQQYSKPNAFADLGCGNGLLVYILNEEGYDGYGYDIRARKLWSFFPESTNKRLLEQPIQPHAFTVPPTVDWLIGNHSDELSPWLPVLAATASYEMNYFLLPCCAYEFSGSKFQRRTSNKSTYQDFFAYTTAISHACGYNTLQDRLKIPSTKRLALIGIERMYDKCEQHSKHSEIMCFVNTEMEKYDCAGVDVKLREKHEKVRNCTQIDRVIIDSLVLKIFHMLLFRDSVEENAQEELCWSAGGRMSMQEIVKRLSRAELLQIKSECGGIKTLLRNKHEIFEFFPDNLIGLRKPKLRINTTSALPVKRRSCFFKQHHPKGCPLTNEQCSFLH